MAFHTGLLLWNSGCQVGEASALPTEPWPWLPPLSLLLKSRGIWHTQVPGCIHTICLIELRFLPVQFRAPMRQGSKRDYSVLKAQAWHWCSSGPLITKHFQLQLFWKFPSIHFNIFKFWLINHVAIAYKHICFQAPGRGIKWLPLLSCPQRFLSFCLFVCFLFLKLVVSHNANKTS